MELDTDVDDDVDNWRIMIQDVETNQWTEVRETAAVGLQHHFPFYLGNV